MAITVKDLQDELDKLRVLRDKKVSAKGVLTKATNAYNEQKGKVYDMMEELGVRSHRTERGGYERPEPTWFASYQDFDAFERWARENNPSLLRIDHHVSKELNEFVRECIDNNVPLPPGLGSYPKLEVKVKK